MQKWIDRLAYLAFLLSLNIAIILICVLTFLAPVIRKKKNKDLLLFPYSQEGSIGYLLRFQQYFSYLEKDGFVFDVCDVCDNDYYEKCINSSRLVQYFFYHQIIWKRFFQVFKARNYKAVFFQRGLFPFYPDLKFPYLERLLRKLNDNIVIDFWDSDFARNPRLVFKSIQYADKMTLVNQFLFDSFRQFKDQKYIWPIGLDVDKYILKTNYNINQTVKLVWTGSPGNLNTQLRPLEGVLAFLAEQFDVHLTIIGKEALSMKGITVRHFPWSEENFYKQLSEADIGLYPYFDDTDIGRGKMAMKVLDYMASGLPAIASPVGLPPNAKDEESVLIVSDFGRWRDQLVRLINDKILREKIGKNGRVIIERHHSIKNSYEQFKKMVLLSK